MKRIILLGLITLSIPCCQIFASTNPSQDITETVKHWASSTKLGDKVLASSERATQSYTVQDFNGFYVNVPLNVIFTKSEKCEVRIEAPKSFIENLNVKVKGCDLYVNTSHPFSFEKGVDPGTIYISAPTLTTVNMTGSGNVKLDQAETTRNLTLTMNGSGDITADVLKAENIFITISGSGGAKVAKLITPDDFHVTIAGSGDIEVEHTDAVDITCSMAGSGNIRLKDITSEEASAIITGSGNVFLDGKTKEASFKIVGSGNVDARKLEASGEKKKFVIGSGNVRL